MLDTVGPELQVVNKTEHPISLQADSLVVLTPDEDKDATPSLLPINFHGLSKVEFSFLIFLIISQIIEFTSISSCIHNLSKHGYMIGCDCEA